MKITTSQLTRLVKEELAALAEGGDLQNTAKGAAMALLDTAEVMGEAPSHEPASLYAQEVAKQANLIMDALVQMEDDEAGRHQRQSPSGDNLREKTMAPSGEFRGEDENPVDKLQGVVYALEDNILPALYGTELEQLANDLHKQIYAKIERLRGGA